MLYIGDVVDNTYQILNEIGSGGMGVIYLAYHIRLQKYVVMKKLKGEFSDISLLRNEADVLKGLHHPFLPQVYDLIEYGSDIYTIIDYINGYDLEYYIKNNYSFSESQLIKWLKQLCEVLQYLHGQNPPILHTDIKPANIIVTADGNICLIDFGISLGVNNSIKGYSKNYSSPEQYENIKSALQGCSYQPYELDARTDVYSLGAAFYHLMSGVMPDISNPCQIPLSKYSLNYSEALVSIIDKSMAYDREQRFSSAAKMYSSLENIKKLDTRYKKYVLFQLLSSLLAGIMIVSGIAMMVFGNSEQVKNEYSIQYSAFLDYYQSGEDRSAIEAGNVLLNNSKYSSFFDNNTKAQTLHAIGDCFYRNEDYANASQYYADAVEYSAETDNPEIYYRDYAIALIKNNSEDKANAVLNEAAEKFPDSAMLRIINAEFEYQRKNYLEAINIIKQCLEIEMSDSDRYTAYILYGDACKKIENYSEAVSAYNCALQIDEDISLLRKIGSANLALADKNSVIDTAALSNAKNAYLKIYNEYFLSADDGINLAQSYRLSKDYSNAKTVLEQLADTYPDDYRIYIQLAFVCYESNDSRTSMYCENAHNLYINADDASKNKTNEEDIEKFKSIYNSYCSSAW